MFESTLLSVPCEISCKWPVDLLCFHSGSIFGTGLARDSPSLRLTPAAALWRCVALLTKACTDAENTPMHNYSYSTRSFYTHWPLPLSLQFLAGERDRFLWLFRLWHQHLFPTSCYCLPAQEVHHKSQEKLQPGSSCVRWWRGGSVKHSWQEREIIQNHPKISLKK